MESLHIRELLFADRKAFRSGTRIRVGAGAEGAGNRNVYIVTDARCIVRRPVERRRSTSNPAAAGEHQR